MRFHESMKKKSLTQYLEESHPEKIFFFPHELQSLVKLCPQHIHWVTGFSLLCLLCSVGQCTEHIQGILFDLLKPTVKGGRPHSGSIGLRNSNGIPEFNTELSTNQAPTELKCDGLNLPRSLQVRAQNTQQNTHSSADSFVAENTSRPNYL